jgi:hypothetical protein
MEVKGKKSFPSQGGKNIWQGVRPYNRVREIKTAVSA